MLKFLQENDLLQAVGSTEFESDPTSGSHALQTFLSSMNDGHIVWWKCIKFRSYNLFV